MDFLYKIQQFMAGRNGFDAFSGFLAVTSFVLSVANVFVWDFWVSLVLFLLEFLLLGYAIFRIFSKNIYMRMAENRRFLKIWTPVKNFFVLTKNRFRDIKTHRYRKCKHCKANLRLKRVKGKHTVRCPKCKKEFKVNIIV